MAIKAFSIANVLRRFIGAKRDRSLSERENVLLSGFQMTNKEQRSLSNQIQKRYIAEYQDTIQQELDALGIDEPARRPRGAELRTIKRMVKGDVESILQTYENEARTFVRNLLKREPDLKVSEYKSRMRDWQRQRWETKIPQLDLASRANAANYARRRFMQKNNLTDGLFIWDASPPIVANSHEECIRRVRLGAAPWQSEAQTWDRPHPNCRHIMVRVVGAPPQASKLFRG